MLSALEMCQQCLFLQMNMNQNWNNEYKILFKRPPLVCDMQYTSLAFCFWRYQGLFLVCSLVKTSVGFGLLSK